MDVKGLRTLNMVGVILFCLIGFLIAIVYFYNYLTLFRVFGRDTTVCTIIYFIWMFILIISTILLYKYTVVGLDHENYESAKHWTLFGIIVGFMGGIIPFVIFIISYVSFDDAVRRTQMEQIPHGYYQQPILPKGCSSCKRQIPYDSMLCPYCGIRQIPPPQLYRPPRMPQN